MNPTAMAILAQTKELIDSATGIGREHGFNAMLVFIMMLFVGIITIRLLRAWENTNTKITDAQVESYGAHKDFATTTGAAVKAMTEALLRIDQTNQSINNAIELIASTGVGNGKILGDVQHRAEVMQKAAVETILVIASIIEKDDKLHAERLRSIAEEMRR